MSDNKIPVPGNYISDSNPSFKVTVEDVEQVDDDFFLVSLVKFGSENDMSEMGQELDPDEWHKYVEAHQLRHLTEE